MTEKEIAARIGEAPGVTVISFTEHPPAWEIGTTIQVEVEDGATLYRLVSAVESSRCQMRIVPGPAVGTFRYSIKIWHPNYGRFLQKLADNFSVKLASKEQMVA